MKLGRVLLQSKDLLAFQLSNFVYAVWLALAVHEVTTIPWQELLIVEAIAWISTAPFYTQSADIGKLPPSSLRSFTRYAVGVKGLIAACVYLGWVLVRHPSVELGAVGLLCLLGPVVLPQWTLFRHGFGLYSLSLGFCRILFVVCVHLVPGNLELSLAAYALQHILPPILVVASQRPGSGMLARDFSLKDSIYTSVAFSCRYAFIATLSASLLSAATISLLPILALLDRTLRPIFPLIAPYLMRHSDLASDRQLQACVLVLAAAAMALGFGAALTSHPVPVSYCALLALEAAGAAYFVGVRRYRSRKFAMLAAGIFTIATVALLLNGISLIAAVAIIGAGVAQALLPIAETGIDRGRRDRA